MLPNTVPGTPAGSQLPVSTVSRETTASSLTLIFSEDCIFQFSEMDFTVDETGNAESLQATAKMFAVSKIKTVFLR